MRPVVQRVSSARVVVADERVGEIGRGLCALVGVTHSDTEAQAERMAIKLAGLRLFDDGSGTMNLSVAEVGGAVLLVSQFTLYGDTTRGRRPSWSAAAGGGQAEPLVRLVAAVLAERAVAVATGRFGAAMEVHLVNDGPVTVIVDT